MEVELEAGSGWRDLGGGRVEEGNWVEEEEGANAVEEDVAAGGRVDEKGRGRLSEGRGGGADVELDKDGWDPFRDRLGGGGTWKTESEEE